MGRIGGMNVSPDGQKVVYTVAYYSVPENRSNREVFVTLFMLWYAREGFSAGEWLAVVWHDQKKETTFHVRLPNFTISANRPERNRRCV